MSGPRSGPRRYCAAAKRSRSAGLWLGRMRRSVAATVSIGALSRRERILISACLVLITALAWGYLVHLDRQMSSSMEYDTMMREMGMTMDMPWTAADVFFTFAMWAVMMVGMMTPSAAPMILIYGQVARQARTLDRNERRKLVVERQKRVL